MEGFSKTKLEYRIIKYKPAVTRVEEWTNEEIGVGAAIANGNHGEKGKIALLVIKVITLTKQISSIDIEGKKILEEGSKEKTKAKVIKKKQSPTRFIKRVKIPEVIED